VSAFLSAADVELLTKRKRFTAQRKALDALGIRYVKAADGEPLVRTADLDVKSRPAQRMGPRWHLIGA
jgi:hypothetical protein